jgi:hypothetical protein
LEILNKLYVNNNIELNNFYIALIYKNVPIIKKILNYIIDPSNIDDLNDDKDIDVFTHIPPKVEHKFIYVYVSDDEIIDKNSDFYIKKILKTIKNSCRNFKMSLDKKDEFIDYFVSDEHINTSNCTIINILIKKLLIEMIDVNFYIRKFETYIILLLYFIYSSNNLKFNLNKITGVKLGNLFTDNSKEIEKIKNIKYKINNIYIENIRTKVEYNCIDLNNLNINKQDGFYKYILTINTEHNINKEEDLFENLIIKYFILESSHKDNFIFKYIELFYIFYCYKNQ